MLLFVNCMVLLQVPADVPADSHDGGLAGPADDAGERDRGHHRGREQGQPDGHGGSVCIRSSRGGTTQGQQRSWK